MDAELEQLVATFQGNAQKEKGNLLWGRSSSISWKTLNLPGSEEKSLEGLPSRSCNFLHVMHQF